MGPGRAHEAGRSSCVVVQIAQRCSTLWLSAWRVGAFRPLVPLQGLLGGITESGSDGRGWDSAFSSHREGESLFERRGKPPMNMV